MDLIDFLDTEPFPTVREKRHRLPRECYLGMQRLSFTCCIKDGAPAFSDPVTVAALTDCLHRAITKHQAKNWAYVFMPEHLHCILEGTAETSDLWLAVYSFKTSSGTWLYHNHPGIKWQKDYYDHIHRSDKTLAQHISYIIGNPIRRGLVEDWLQYPYLGSLDHDIREIAMTW